MNFYDGREETPFLPRSKVVDVLKKKIGLPLPSARYCFFSFCHVSMLVVVAMHMLILLTDIERRMLDDRGLNQPEEIQGGWNENRYSFSFSTAISLW